MNNSSIFSAGQQSKHLLLDILRKRRADTVTIDGGYLFIFRLQEYLMAALIGKTHDLCLDARTVPGARRRDLARIERGARKILPDQFMDSLVRISDPAGNLRSVYSFG